MTDLNDRVGVPTNDDENQAVTGTFHPKEKGQRPHYSGASCRKRRWRSDQHIPGRSGHLRQHKRNLNSHRLHYCSFGNSVAIELVPSLGKTWNTAAVDKEHAKARSLPCDCSIPKKIQSGNKRVRRTSVLCRGHERVQDERVKYWM